jgi:hypothetical protein
MVKSGDILRFTRFASNDLNPPMWAIACSDPHYVDLVWGGSDTIASCVIKDPYMWGRGENNGSNQYTLVPHDEVPDEVWVTLAKRALLGENV